METLRSFVRPAEGNLAAPLLPLIAAQAREADRSRTVDVSVIKAIRASGLLGMSAVRGLGGGEQSVREAACELEAVAAACASTAWCLWNHLCVFHFYCTTFGPDANAVLSRIVAEREWVTYPNGAGTRVSGVREGGEYVLEGKATFGSGARYGEWALIVFTHDAGGDKPAMSYTLVRFDAPGVRVEPTWDGMSVRASSTDDIVLEGARVPASLVRPFDPDYANTARGTDFPVIDHRYRDDWGGLRVLGLAAQATGVAAAALDDAVGQAAGRRAIFGQPMAQRPGVQMNLGEAAALVASARATWLQGCAETDERIATGVTPTEADQLRQFGYAMVSLRLAGDALGLTLRTLGGNGLRESGTFETHFRDYQAMALHITAHPDRVTELTGKWLLGVR
jgi:butyryl-CoA dehydrogenase